MDVVVQDLQDLVVIAHCPVPEHHVIEWTEALREELPETDELQRHGWSQDEEHYGELAKVGQLQKLDLSESSLDIFDEVVVVGDLTKSVGSQWRVLDGEVQ